MASFSGIYHHALDSKNRVIVPSRFRDGIDPEQDGKGFYLTRGLDGCIFVFTPAVWSEVKRSMKRAGRGPDFTKGQERKFQRLFFAHAYFQEADRQGRVGIGEDLKEHAGIREKVVFVGVENRIEIWDPERWETFESDTGQDYETIAETIFQEGGGL